MILEDGKSKICGVGQLESTLKLGRANGVFQLKDGSLSLVWMLIYPKTSSNLICKLNHDQRLRPCEMKLRLLRYGNQWINILLVLSCPPRVLTDCLKCSNSQDLSEDHPAQLGKQSWLCLSGTPFNISHPVLLPSLTHSFPSLWLPWDCTPDKLSAHNFFLKHHISRKLDNYILSISKPLFKPE